MQQLFAFLRSNKPPTTPELYGILFNTWIFIVIFYSLFHPTNSIIVNVFYSLPHVFVLTVSMFCVVWSIIGYLNQSTWVKSSVLLTDAMFYFWISFSYFNYSIFTVGGGTFFILGVRYLTLYLVTRMHGGSNAKLFTK